MQIRYKDKRIEAICLEQKKAERQLGKPCARKLRSRLSDLMAAANTRELVAGNPHPLRGDREPQFSLSLHGGMRLCFVPDHDPIPRLADGGIDWSSVSCALIVYIGDYHD
ncbi:killer suppression protein HigA [Billgrantia antri]|uniref:Killer suppression protein HigA n=1 Tax=Halomonas sulfidivorans TaxID=2733488 RepID=A0ABX7WKX9_9GAMM|nr:killer suppression protein HigA [Halomonas sulfidivorans]